MDLDLIRRMKSFDRRIGRAETKAPIFQATNTYVPTYGGGVTAGVTTYTTQTGAYVQIGPLVFVWGQVVWTAATGTGNAQISLPITPSVVSVLGNVRCQAVTFAAGAPEPLIVGSFLELRSPASNAATTPVAVEAAGDIIFSIAYQWT